VSVAVAASREYVLVWRTDDCAAYESVYVDKNGVTCSELVIWSADGSRYREVIGGADLTTIRRDWEAASPFDKVQVPDDAGRKVWTHLDATEDEPPAAVPEPEPALASRRVDPQYQPPASRAGADSLDPASVPGSPENRAFMRWLS
jgi:hypothetical protein